MIDNEKGFPSRNTFLRHFGDIKTALIEAGYNPSTIKLHEYTKEDAQAELDRRNGNFDILKFNGCRNKSQIRCRKCKSIFEAATYSLYDNLNDTKGCPFCYEKKRQLYQEKNNITLLYKGKNKNIYKCLKCNNIFKMTVSHASSNNFHCPCCSKVDTKRYKLIKLLDESLQSYYILGFMFADGSFKGNRLVFRLQKKDKEIVDKIINFINPSINSNCSKVDYGFSCMDSYTIQILRKLYNIKNDKTYNPCDISSINDDKFISFLIGFIDGDGNIGHRTDNEAVRITIKLHKSWINNLNEMSTKLYTYFNVRKIPKAGLVTYKNGRQYSNIIFGNRKVIYGLKKFIILNKLFVLDRKWNFI